VPVVAAGLMGLKATVVALIVQALVTIARRSLADPLHWLLALAAFGLVAGRLVPFPFVVIGAALAGMLWGARDAGAPMAAAPRASFPWRSLLVGLALWALPAVAIAMMAGLDSIYADVYRFFTTAALVTFGGAYAVLAWVNQQVVEVYGWLSQAETIAGLALAESTPGPLIIVLQFIGFMTGWNHSATGDAASTATLTALLAAWATFLPSFVFILVGAPYVLRLSQNRRLAAALAGITAAVVGVIASLAVVFGRNVLLPAGMDDADWHAIAIAALALAALQWTRLDVLWVIGGGLALGLVLGFA
jgi:chromate transporter